MDNCSVIAFKQKPSFYLRNYGVKGHEKYDSVICHRMSFGDKHTANQGYYITKRLRYISVSFSTSQPTVAWRHHYRCSTSDWPPYIIYHHPIMFFIELYNDACPSYWFCEVASVSNAIATPQKEIKLWTFLDLPKLNELDFYVIINWLPFIDMTLTVVQSPIASPSLTITLAYIQSQIIGSLR